jgi:hypothetical protein
MVDLKNADVYLVDGKQRVGMRLVLKRNGDATATFGTTGVSRKTVPGWKGKWRTAVQDVPGGWTAEVAVPIRTLTQSGMSLSNLQLNCMSLNATRLGLEGVFLTDPYYSVKFQCCSRFRPLAPPPAKAPPERSFTVRLHFAEIEDAKPGQRVFNVAIQDKTVLEKLDVVREAGGVNKPLVKEFNNVKASSQIVIGLTPDAGASRRGGPPVISGMEVVQEQ